MKKILRDNSLTLVLILLFALSIAGQFIQGKNTYNEERIHLGYSVVSSSEYLSSGHFISSLSENMESEFLQMSLFVLLTMHFYQRGSAESKKFPEDKTTEDLAKEIQEEEFTAIKRKQYPFLWKLYENSLTLTLVALFILFFFLHAYGSMENINLEKMAHKEKLISFKDVFKENEFWFESFQNWQSEFFSIAVLGILSIFLRQKNSSQSKRMNESNLKTGDS